MKAKLTTLAAGLMTSTLVHAHPEHSGTSLLSDIGHLLSEPDHLFAIIVASVLIGGWGLKKLMYSEFSRMDSEQR